MDANALAQVLRELPKFSDPNVLVGTATADDAGVYRLNDMLALVQTVDFFTPIVDDPYTFGAIAAANALSDVYAMGGTPVTALAIAAFPDNVDRAILTGILRGGSEKAHEAGITVIGGHTVRDDVPKYGLAVTGLVHPDRVIRNSTAQPEDALFLTKALGTGILTTARRRNSIAESDLSEAIASMLALNGAASRAMVDSGAHAATDVTGFGLIGHLREMLAGSGTGADIFSEAVPLLSRALALARDGIVPGGSRTNAAQAVEAGVTFDEALDEAMRSVLCDAQTSGGLLIAIGGEDAERFERTARSNGVAVVARIGTVAKRPGLRVHV
ncbi:MAG: selenide, water dikinase SelD [Candidatus Eremiobacteraeota bacterium]|nr:selenide, water dikinase SelD [Candidatus Eremiobacteraeota bacterium]